MKLIMEEDALLDLTDWIAGEAGAGEEEEGISEALAARLLGLDQED